METPLDEARSLRRCVRELAALSALSAAWTQTDPPGIAASLADVLLRSVTQADFLYVRLLDPAQALADAQTAMEQTFAEVDSNE